jgi:hypothetical protein
MIQIPADDAALTAFVEGWDARDAGNPRGAMGV